MLSRLSLMILALLVSVSGGAAQGLLISQMQCQAEYRGIAYQGVFQVGLFQYAGSAGIGAAGDRTQLNLLIRSGRADEIPGTLVLMGEFVAPGTIVHIEAPNVVGGQGTGGIVVNGMAHRATYATFFLVNGGVVAVTEDGERIEYVCQ